MLKYFRHFFFLLITTYATFIVYAHLSKYWVNYGGPSSTMMKKEFPLILIFSFIAYVPIKSKKRAIGYFLPLIPIYGLYLGFDIFYNCLSRSLRISDFQNFFELFDAAPILAICISASIVILLIPTFIATIRWFMDCSFPKGLFLLSTKIFLFAMLFFILTTDTFHNRFLKDNLHLNEKNVANNIKSLGRFNNIIYLHYERKKVSNKIENLAGKIPISFKKELFPGVVVNSRPNIHIVVLESFIDPRRIKNNGFNRSPLASELKKHLLENKYFSSVISPVYGGGTCQAEFELLTGIPALALIESYDFNTLDGFPTNGFIQQIRKNGYLTHATIGTHSAYFNSPNAYKSIGFEKTLFLKKKHSISKTLSSLLHNGKEDKIIFDGDLYEQNLKILKKHLLSNKSDQPILNYVLGMYGHLPFDRNTHKRPETISSSHPNVNLHKIANQFYYRTKSLAMFVDKLVELDPQSIILVISDHLPSILKKNTQYSEEKHNNIALFLKNGKPQDISGEKYYGIPWMIWDIITDREQNGIRVLSEEKIKQLYFQILAESRGILQVKTETNSNMTSLPTVDDHEGEI